MATNPADPDGEQGPQPVKPTMPAMSAAARPALEHLPAIDTCTKVLATAGRAGLGRIQLRGRGNPPGANRGKPTP